MIDTICMYAICKDEAKNAEAWYDNVKEADRVVVLDTGSTDGTQDILRALGAEVHEKAYPKPFRFDVARNDSLELAKATGCDVLATTDFDERFTPGWSDIVRSEWVLGKHTRATYDNRYEDNEECQGLNWIHSYDWTWRYPCHEALFRGDSMDYYFHEELDLRGRVCLQHRQDHSKDRSQYLPLLKLRYEEFPDDQNSAAYFVREYMYLEKPDEILELEPVLSAMPLSGNAGAWVCISISWAHEVKGELLEAERWMFRGFQCDPDCRTASTGLARLLSDRGKDMAAEGILRQSFNDSVLTDRPIFVDNEDVWLWRMEDWLGVTYYRQGRYADAERCFAHALEGAKGESAEHVRKNLGFARSMQGGER